MASANGQQGVTCRSCGASRGEIVLDLGAQPPCDTFHPASDPGPDPAYPLRMWGCAGCGLAQLVEDPGSPEEPQGRQPRSMRDLAARAVDRLARAGWLREGRTVTEFVSPHGGSWAAPMSEYGMAAVPPGAGEPVDLVVDVYGLMHEPDQDGALARRAARVAEGGVAVFQIHSLATILTHRQWSDLRHGHYAYWSLPALAAGLRRHGLGIHRAWWEPTSGGTLLVAATRQPAPDEETKALIAAERAAGAGDLEVMRGLQRAADTTAATLRRWLGGQRQAGRRVVGYGAASRGVPVLCHAGIDATLLPMLADASTAKHGRRMPGVDVPIVEPDEMLAYRPDLVLLFLPDLLGEVRTALPGVEAAGGQWVVLDGESVVVDPATPVSR